MEQPKWHNGCELCDSYEASFELLLYLRLISSNYGQRARKNRSHSALDVCFKLKMCFKILRQCFYAVTDSLQLLSLHVNATVIILNESSM